MDVVFADVVPTQVIFYSISDHTRSLIGGSCLSLSGFARDV